MIERAASLVWLVASRQESFRVWGRFDHGKPFVATEHVMTIAGVIAILAALALVWQRVAKRSQREFFANSPTRLFRELCRAHRLSRASCRLLKQLAAERRVETPAVLFLEPEHFDTTDVPPRLKSSVGELRRLHTKLFGKESPSH